MKYISLDPGEATGWATWDAEGQLLDCGTDPLWKVIDALASTGLPAAVSLEYVNPPIHLHEAFAGWQELICEDWALYPWELENMAWDSCRTARGIGALELLCRTTGRAIHLQGAKIKEDAEIAGAEVLFDRPLHENRHQNDAKRHGVYFFARRAPGYTATVANPPTEGTHTE